MTEQQGQLFLCTSCSHTSSYQTSCHEYRASLWGRVWVFPKFSSFLFRLSFLPSFFLPSLSCVIGTIIIYLQLVIAGISSRVTSSFQSICLDIVVSRRLYTQCMHFCFLCSYFVHIKVFLKNICASLVYSVFRGKKFCLIPLYWWQRQLWASMWMPVTDLKSL